MQAVKSRDTKPELAIRRVVHSAGFRYRLHRGDLPGCPDLVFPARRKIIFVHGCFWHGHTCHRGSRVPETNTAYWVAKIERNQIRDARIHERLKRAGWKILIVWECEIKPEITESVLNFLK